MCQPTQHATATAILMGDELLKYFVFLVISKPDWSDDWLSYTIMGTTEYIIMVFSLYYSTALFTTLFTVYYSRPADIEEEKKFKFVHKQDFVDLECPQFLQCLKDNLQECGSQERSKSIK